LFFALVLYLLLFSRVHVLHPTLQTGVTRLCTWYLYHAIAGLRLPLLNFFVLF
jgi:hypothetical protein